jgi:hypothetical protein
MGILEGLTASQLSDKYVSEEQKRKNEGLMDALKNMPEEAWDNMHWLDKAALISSVTPVVNASPIAWGLGAAADVRSAVQEPDQFFQPANLAMTGLSYAPMGRLGKYGEQLGIWGGGTAKNAPAEDMFQASQMAKQGEKPDRIYDKTKIRVDDAGNTSFEIPDYPSNLGGDLSTFKVGQTATLQDVLKHPELYKNYPDMQYMDVRFTDDPSRSAMAWYTPSADTVTFNKTGMPKDINEQRSTLLHELQHAVQMREGTPTGGSISLGEKIPNIADMAQNNIARKKADIDKQMAESRAAHNVDEVSMLAETSRKMDEINRLRGYLEDYYKGGNLTDKRRHIFSSGASLMEHNAEYRMRNDISWAKKHRPKSERNANYEEYIQRAIKAGEESLDPNLVKQVRAETVKNPTQKYERAINKWVKDEGSLRNQRYALNEAQDILNPIIKDRTQTAGLGLGEPTQLSRNRAGAFWNYENLAGEAEARLVQERMNTPPAELGNPFRGEVYSQYPSMGQTYIRPDNSVDPNSTLGAAVYEFWDDIYKKLGYK